MVVAETIDQAKDTAELLENSYYEPRGGQFLAASFIDYGMPRAGTLPFLTTALSEVPARRSAAGGSLRTGLK